MRIIIKEKFKSDYITRAAGEKLRQMICQVPGPVVLDFQGIKVASSSFFDEGIAKLPLAGLKENWIRQNLHFDNLDKWDAVLLQKVCLARGLKLFD